MVGAAMLLTDDVQAVVAAACAIAFAKSVARILPSAQSEEILECYVNELHRIATLTDEPQAKAMLCKLKHTLMECEPGV